MTVEMLFGDEEEKYDRQKSLLITKSFVNEGFKNEEIKSNGRVVEGEYQQELEEIDFEIENENDIEEDVDQYVDDLFDFRWYLIGQLFNVIACDWLIRKKFIKQSDIQQSTKHFVQTRETKLYSAHSKSSKSTRIDK